MVGSFRSTDGLAIRAMGVGSGCWLTDELGDSRWLGRQDQPHRFRPEQGSRHLLQVWADQQRHFGLGENVFLKIDSWRNFDHSQPIFGQLDDAAFGDVEDLLASLAAHLAGERNLRYFRDEFCDRAIGADPELAMLDLDVLLASGEVAGKNDLGRTRDDVIEAATPAVTCGRAGSEEASTSPAAETSRNDSIATSNPPPCSSVNWSMLCSSASGFSADPNANPVAGKPPTAPCSMTHVTSSAWPSSSSTLGMAAEIPKPRLTMALTCSSAAARRAITFSRPNSTGSMSSRSRCISPDKAGSYNVWVVCI